VLNDMKKKGEQCKNAHYKDQIQISTAAQFSIQLPIEENTAK
jgi:hypothetical protein